MNEPFVGGLFYHPGGTSPQDVMRRLIDETVDPRLDDPFVITLLETRNKLKKIQERTGRLEVKRLEIERNLQDCKGQEAVLIAAFENQKRLIELYDETGQIDEALIPECREAFDAQWVQFSQDTCKAVEAELAPIVGVGGALSGWKIDRRRVDEDFVYVTLKRRREEIVPREKPSFENLHKAVRRSLLRYTNPGFDRTLRNRVNVDWFARFFTPRRAAAP